jgi:hypothetical protein
MSIEVERATIPCTCCGAMVTELRRGRCWGCYTKWVELRPVPKGACCLVCTERRRDNLRSMEVMGQWATLCHICSARTLKLSQVPESLDTLRTILTRDRRQDDRRGDGVERRIFPRERRVGDRRAAPRPGTNDDTNPGFEMPVFDDIEIEIKDEDIEVMEQTLVKEAPKRR